MNTNSHGEIRGKRNKSGQIESQENAALHINGRELTETVLSESELHRRLLEQQKIIQTSLDGFWVARAADARILEANEAFCSMVGYSRDELLSMCISDLEADESPAEIAAHIEKIMAAGHDRFETRHRHKQGQLVDLEVSSSYSKMNGGEFFVFARDITERKRMEKVVAAREQEFRSLAESSPDSIIRYDRDGRILYLNDRLLKQLELASAEGVIGKRPGEVWTDGRFAELERAAARVADSGSQVDIELIVPTKNGAFHYHQIFVVPERDVGGQIIGTIAFGRDITPIRETERKLKHFIDNLPGMAYTFRLSPDGHACFPFISPSVEKFYGLKPEDVQNDMAPLHNFWHPDDQMHLEAAAAESARTMTPIHLEARVCRPGQPECWLEVRALPEREADGGIVWYGLMLDITERKQHEEQLALLNYALDHVKEAVFLYDDDIRFSYVNAYAAKYLGYSREELLGMSVPDIDPDFQREQMLAHWRDIQALGSESFESRHKTKSGHVFPVDVMSNYFESGGKGYSLALCRDITERKVAEEALRASEQQFRTLAENLPDILIRYDHEGRRTYVNPAQERLFAVTSKQTLGLTPEEANPMHLSEAYQLALQHTLATGERSEFEMEVLAPSGAVRTGFICIAAERAADGQISGAITIGRDITKLKQTEQQLRELTAHLQTVREEEKARLAREIHDDLGSTLAALNLKLSHLLDFELSESLKNSPLFARIESMSPLLESAIAATRRIIADMRPDVLDNLGLFAALKWQAEQFHQHTGIMCRIVCANDLGCVDCRECAYQLDKTQSINLFRIFQEALTNVSRHSGATSVVAEYRPGADHVHLSISDDGCGLPEGHVPATTSFGIRGMRERVGQLGGQLAFDNALGGGLCVTVRLPFVAGNKGDADNPA